MFENLTVTKEEVKKTTNYNHLGKSYEKKIYVLVQNKIQQQNYLKILFLDLQRAGFQIREKGKLYGETVKNLSGIDIKNLFEKEFVPFYNYGDN